MAVATSRRPPEIEDEVIEHFSEEAKPKKLKLSKKAIFHDVMIAWVNGLKGKKKASVTRLDLEHRAELEAYRLQLPFDTLPDDWLKRLCEATHFKLNEKKKKDDDDDDDDDEDDLEQILPLKPLSRPRDASEKSMAAISERRSKPEHRLLTLAEIKCEPEEMLMPSKKPFVDLTTKSPPKFWLAALARGKILPRKMTVIPVDGMNILMYDYTPKSVDEQGRQIKYPVWNRGEGVEELNFLFERTPSSDRVLVNVMEEPFYWIFDD